MCVFKVAASAAELGMETLWALRPFFEVRPGLRSGVEVLRSAYEARGLPPPEVPPDYLLDIDEEEAVPFESEPKEELDTELEASRCRALLLEVIRRAAHDWVLYRQHERMELKALAHHAYVWLFEEEAGHPNWEERDSAWMEVRGDLDEVRYEQGPRSFTSFVSLCEAIGLIPNEVRTQVRKMTIESVLYAGRPAETRRPVRKDDPLPLAEHSAGTVDLGGLEADFDKAQGMWVPPEYVGYATVDVALNWA